MYCQQCGHELPPGANNCPACGSQVVPPAHSHRSGATLNLDEAIADAKKAAKDLVSITAQLSERLAAKAERVAKDPSGSAKRGVRRMATELDKARKEIDKILNNL